MITREQLLEAGYKQFRVHHKEFCKVGYQKRFDDERGKKYFITIYEYDHRDLIAMGHTCPEFSYGPDCQFETYGTTFDVKMLCDDSKTVQDVEAFYERLWASMGCDYYEEWD